MLFADPATTLSTARILVDRALNRACGQECVDWATSMLERGASGKVVAMLAGMTPPFNHFELAELRDQALRELGVAEEDKATVACRYAAECLRSALDGYADVAESIRFLAELCVAFDYSRELFDFYLLHYAYNDLKDSTYSYHWPAATRDTILSIIRE